MRKIYFGVSLVILTGCHDAEGNFSLFNSFFLMVMLVIIFFIVADQQRKYLGQKENSLDQSNKDFANEFTFRLKEKNISALNCVLKPPDYGLAIFDNKDQIAVFTSNRGMHFIPREKIDSCELTINYKTIEPAKSTTPDVRGNTPDITGVAVTNEFQSATLNITVDDLSTPFFTLSFLDLEIAEKYHALIKDLLFKKENL
ncbi:MAG: hypothetical protein ABIR19_06495 [Ginsengibacter sp.]